ncbi:hypothetical protein KKH30_00465 [Candidatus Micrarchaeota archaeon]|nr:hypothetical protein [Candidatus Micrarchaeota archaeon]MBU1939216.1 hypothetical protein [Candidatus Micrarchaeota archaeon]
MGGKKKYKKGIESLDRRIAEHKEKIKTAKSPGAIGYFEDEIREFERQKKKKRKRL